MICSFCREPVDLNDPHLYRAVKSWEIRREAGGTHGLTLPERLPEYAHSGCVVKIRNGIDPAQETLV